MKWEKMGKMFQDKKNVTKHSDKMHVKLECDECDKMFRCEAVLKINHEAELYHYYNSDKCIYTWVYNHAVYTPYIHTFMKYACTKLWEKAVYVQTLVGC